MNSTIEEIRADEQFKKFKRMFLRVQKTITLDEYVAECQTLHASRLSTKISDSKGQFSPQMLMDANAIDLSSRSRMAFIAANLKLRLSKLESAMDAIDSYIVNQYGSQIQARTIDERKKFVHRVLKNYVQYIDECKAGLSFIEALMKDIDQSGFSMRNMVDCLKLLSETKGKII